MRCFLFRQRLCAKVCADRFIIDSRHLPAAFLTAKAFHILCTGHKALFGQNGRAIHIFQQGEAALCPYFGVGTFHKLFLVVFQILNVSDSPAPTQ